MGYYVSDIIGDTFKTWAKNEVEFITAPTGSGKTIFILYKLVEYAVLKNRVLYLVNRVLLKDQIKERITLDVKPKLRDNPLITEESLKNVITVKTYQEIEQVCKRQEKNCLEVGDYRYIVADEAHYFLTDSLFNSNTEISFNWIIGLRNQCTLIFMSATIGEIKNYIVTKYKLKPFDERRGAYVTYDGIDIQCRYREYTGEQDHSWVNLKSLNGIKKFQCS